MYIKANNSIITLLALYRFLACLFPAYFLNIYLPLYKIWLYINSISAIPTTYVNPCQPSPCGPNSQCREINDQAVCSCLSNYLGSPPGCRPECVVSSECQQTKACINQKCIDPCPGTCGTNSICRVNNHSPICSCKNGYIGDPFTRCNPIPRKWWKTHLSRLSILNLFLAKQLRLQSFKTKLEILATHHHVDLFPSVEIQMVFHRAHVFPHILELRLIANPSVPLTQNVWAIERAFVKSALILAQVPVD